MTHCRNATEAGDQGKVDIAFLRDQDAGVDLRAAKARRAWCRTQRVTGPLLSPSQYTKGPLLAGSPGADGIASLRGQDCKPHPCGLGLRPRSLRLRPKSFLTILSNLPSPVGPLLSPSQYTKGPLLAGLLCTGWGTRIRT